MKTNKEKNIYNEGFILGVLHAAEFISKKDNNPLRVQELINTFIDGKMRYVMVKRLAKAHKIGINWSELNITIQKTM